MRSILKLAALPHLVLQHVKEVFPDIPDNSHSLKSEPYLPNL